MFPTIRFAAFFAVTWVLLVGARGRRTLWRVVLLGANAVFMDAFYTDVRPALAEWRESRGLAADPMAAYAASGYQQQIAADRVGGTQAGWGA